MYSSNLQIYKKMAVVLIYLMRCVYLIQFDIGEQKPIDQHHILFVLLQAFCCWSSTHPNCLRHRHSLTLAFSVFGFKHQSEETKGLCTDV